MLINLESDLKIVQGDCVAVERHQRMQFEAVDFFGTRCMFANAFIVPPPSCAGPRTHLPPRFPKNIYVLKKSYSAKYFRIILK